MLALLVDVLVLAGAVAAGVLCLRAARHGDGRARRGWIALAVACGSWAVSQALWVLLVDVLGERLPFPSPVELGYLVFPLAGALGLRLVATSTAGQSTARLVLDRLMIGCSVVIVSWASVMDTVVDNPSGSWATDAIALYFPLSYVWLLTVVVLAVARLDRNLTRSVLLGAGMLLMAVTDHLLVYELAHGAVRGDAMVDLGWALGFVLIGAGALARCCTRAEVLRSAGLAAWNAVAPYAPLIVAAVVVAVDLVVATGDDTVTEFLLLVLVGLVLARQYVMLRDNMTLVAAVREREERLHHQAFHDALTGLPNRALFLDRLGHALDLAARDGREVSVAFLDLDGFKGVNDSLGHAAGDALLVRVAERLRGSLRAADTVARLGGDEFAVLVEQGDPTAVADGLVEALESPFPLAGRTVSISASVGVATMEPGRGGPARATTLLHRADVAMYAVKMNGKADVRVHSPGLDLAQRPDEASLRRAFAAALAEGRVRAAYQPVVDPVSGRIAALETLARWTHDGVEVPPATFVPISIASGLAEQLTAAMLEQACAQLDGWNTALGHRRLRVAVNVNPTEFSDAGLPDRVAALLHRHRLGPDQLALEMTEIAVGNRPAVAMEVMRALRAGGVRLALDDFGTGYSTLSRLSATPVDTVKIDRVFVVDIDHDDRQRSFLAALLKLCRHLGLRTVAEGVERPGQLRELRRMGCDLVQGHLIGYPADAATTSGLVLADEPLLTDALLALPR